jgi:catechol 2,3-dioxygenase-like lactoylglutathione lyase family enzyme
MAVEVSSQLKVTGIDHVVLWVENLERSKRFYLDVLGMTVAHESPWQSFLHCGTQQVALFQAQEGQKVAPGSEVNHMALRLAEGEYEQVKVALERAGCQVTGRPGDPHCIYFQDPDGHRLQLLTPAERG